MCIYTHSVLFLNDMAIKLIHCFVYFTEIRHKHRINFTASTSQAIPWVGLYPTYEQRLIFTNEEQLKEISSKMGIIA